MDRPLTKHWRYPCSSLPSDTWARCPTRLGRLTPDEEALRTEDVTCAQCLGILSDWAEFALLRLSQPGESFCTIDFSKYPP